MDKETLEELESMGITPQEIIDREEKSLFFEDFEVPYVEWNKELNVLRKLGVMITGKENMEELVEILANKTAEPFKIRVRELNEVLQASNEEMLNLEDEIQNYYEPKIDVLTKDLIALRGKVENQLSVLGAISRYVLAKGSRPTNIEGFWEYIDDVYRYSSENNEHVRRMNFKDFRDTLTEMLESGVLCYITGNSGFHYLGVPIVQQLGKDIEVVIKTNYAEIFRKNEESIANLTTLYMEERTEREKLSNQTEKQGEELEEIKNELGEKDKELEDLENLYKKQEAELNKERDRANGLQADIEELNGKLSLYEKREPLTPDLIGTTELNLMHALHLHAYQNKYQPNDEQLIKTCMGLFYNNIEPTSDEYSAKTELLHSCLEKLFENNRFYKFPDGKINFFLPYELRRRRRY